MSTAINWLLKVGVLPVFDTIHNHGYLKRILKGRRTALNMHLLRAGFREYIKLLLLTLMCSTRRATSKLKENGSEGGKTGSRERLTV